MEDPLKFAPVEGVLGAALVLAVVATVLLCWRFRSSELGLFPHSWDSPWHGSC